MDAPGNFRSLKTNEWKQLQDLADRFEEAWRTADSVDLAAFLPPVGDPLRSEALQEFIKTELEIRWKRDQVATLEEYADKFPELGGVRALAPELVYEEYRVRQVFGDKPSLALYQNRFPDQFPAMQRLVEEQSFATPRTSPPTVRSPEPAPTPPKDKDASAGSFSTIRGVTTSSVTISPGEAYTLVRPIGHGSYADVWQGLAPGGIPVAVKIIRRPIEEDEAKQELKSLELIKELRHPHLLQTQAFWIWEGKLHIVQELADSTLRDRLKACLKEGQSGIPPKELLRYLKEAAEAVDFLHKHRVHHRDIKPENILMVQQHAKVGDFGLARLLQHEQMSVTGGAGTPGYMPPEIWGGKISPQSDQYSLALAYAELRLGRRVISGPSHVEVMLKHLEETPDLAPLDKDEQEVILKALAKKPEQRYRTCAEFVEALEPTLGLSGSATHPLLLAPTPSRRRFLTRAALTLPAAALGGYGFWYFFIRKPPPPPPPPPYLPASCDPAAGAQIVADKDGKRFYDRIHLKYHELQGGEKIVFLLIPQKRPDDPPTFYIMENKVCNELFGKFAAERPDAVRLESPIEPWIESVQLMLEPLFRLDVKKRASYWNWGGFADGKHLGNANPRHPVFGVTWFEANAFAKWMGANINLPTAIQWDKASGFYEYLNTFEEWVKTQRGGKSPDEEVSDEEVLKAWQEFDDYVTSLGRPQGPFQGTWSDDGRLELVSALLTSDPHGAAGRVLVASVREFQSREIAVNRRNQGPLAIGEAKRDISPFGCRDMAGNGEEWLRQGKGEGVDESTEVRGRSYLDRRGPLYYKYLHEARAHQGLAGGIGRRNRYEAFPFLGFRVVLEIPD